MENVGRGIIKGTRCIDGIRVEEEQQDKIESLETGKSFSLVAYQQDMREQFGIELTTSELFGYETFAEKYKPSKLIECSRRH